MASVQRALLSSLRALRTSRIDYFLLHEPVGMLNGDSRGLVDYLETERSRTTIGHWGPAGDLTRMDGTVAALSAAAPVLQIPYDLIAGYGGPCPEPHRRSITYGFLLEALPRVQGVLSRDPIFRQQCSELLDADLSEAITVVRLLVRDAVLHNRGGTLLLSSTKPENLEITCTAAESALPNEALVASMVREKCLNMVAPQR